MQRIVNVLVLALLLISTAQSCKNEKEEKPNGGLKAIFKKSKITSPSNNEKVSLGEEVIFEVAMKSDSNQIDSVKLFFNDLIVDGENNKATINTRLTGVGRPRLILNVYLNGGAKETHYPKIRVMPPAPKEFVYEAKNAFPHDRQAYTQGLLFEGGALYEGTGQNGQSELRKVDLKTGDVINSVKLDNKYFGEGIAVCKNKIFQLTYTSQQVFVYDLDFNKENTYTYNTQGWGLTTMNDTLVMSDGTEYLYFRSPDDFSELKKVAVWDENGRVLKLNELEYIDGIIYANIYLKDLIVMIDPKSGAVVGRIDMTGLYTQRNISDSDYVLNGIAYDQNTGKIYVTGKYWPSIYEVSFIEQTNL